MVAGIHPGSGSTSEGHERATKSSAARRAICYSRKPGLISGATEDIDMVLCSRGGGKDFADAIEGYLEAGRYQSKERSDGKKEYCVSKPETAELSGHAPSSLYASPGTIVASGDVAATRSQSTTMC